MILQLYWRSKRRRKNRIPYPRQPLWRRSIQSTLHWQRSPNSNGGAAPTPQRAPPPSTFPDPEPIRAAPVVTGPPQLSEVIDSGSEVPCTPGREWQRRGSPTAISLHPSTTLEASNGEEPGEEPEGERSSREASSEEDEPTEPGSFSSFETQLRLVHWDMVRVLKLSDRRSFKTRTGGEETHSTLFPTLPLDRLCVDHSWVCCVTCFGGRHFHNKIIKNLCVHMINASLK